MCKSPNAPYYLMPWNPSGFSSHSEQIQTPNRGLQGSVWTGPGYLPSLISYCSSPPSLLQPLWTTGCSLICQGNSRLRASALVPSASNVIPLAVTCLRLWFHLELHSDLNSPGSSPQPIPTLTPFSLPTRASLYLLIQLHLFFIAFITIWYYITYLFCWGFFSLFLLSLEYKFHQRRDLISFFPCCSPIA